jgi:secondary thiamine-phosphate synthase enzyme
MHFLYNKKLFHAFHFLTFLWYQNCHFKVLIVNNLIYKRFKKEGIMHQTITINTREHSEMIDITSLIGQEVDKSGIKDGMCLLFVPHTTAGVTINESADPSVRLDIQAVLDKLVPWEGFYRHLEGNSAAHIKSSIMGSSVMAIIESGRLKLGTWQGIFFCEFDGPRSRRLYMRLQ